MSRVLTAADAVSSGKADDLHTGGVEVEPMLVDDTGYSRYVIIPGAADEYDDIVALRKEHLDVFWIAQEIDLVVDVTHWGTLDKNEQHFIKTVLAFFAASDGIVLENLAKRFFEDVKVAEVRNFYAVQMMFESIHSEMYSLLITTLVSQQNERDMLFKAVLSFPTIKAKADWAVKYIESGESFAIRLVAFAAVEGVFFSASFCALFWLKKRGIMPGLCFSNELISRDEGLHTKCACLLFKKLKFPSGEDTVHRIIGDAVKIEKEFVTESLPVNLIGMNKVMMCKYIEYVADKMIVDLGFSKLYNSRNPFPWMETIGMRGKTNFFERVVAEYVHGTPRRSIASAPLPLRHKKSAKPRRVRELSTSSPIPNEITLPGPQKPHYLSKEIIRTDKPITSAPLHLVALENADY